MLAERERVLLESTVMIYDIFLSFRHQFQPQFFGFFQADREVLNSTKHLVLDFHRKIGDGAIALLLYSLAPPLSLLAGDVRGGYDPDIWVDKEERHDLTMTGFRGVCQFERLDLMLQNIGPCQETPFGCVNRSDVLHARPILFTAKDDPKPIMVVLFIGNFGTSVGGALLPES